MSAAAARPRPSRGEPVTVGSGTVQRFRSMPSSVTRGRSKPSRRMVRAGAARTHWIRGFVTFQRRGGAADGVSMATAVP
jgi:hypothetical protein